MSADTQASTPAAAKCSAFHLEVVQEQQAEVVQSQTVGTSQLGPSLAEVCMGVG